MNIDTAQTLTLAIAPTLKGKSINVFSHGYQGQNYEKACIVGEIISEYDDAARTPHTGGFANYAEYWESYMTAEKLALAKNTLLLLDDNGERIGICLPNNSFFDEPTFTLSDADRQVFFSEIN